VPANEFDSKILWQIGKNGVTKTLKTFLKSDFVCKKFNIFAGTFAWNNVPLTKFSVVFEHNNGAERRWFTVFARADDCQSSRISGRDASIDERCLDDYGESVGIIGRSSLLHFSRIFNLHGIF
jgi:hypothetical protein